MKLPNQLQQQTNKAIHKVTIAADHAWKEACLEAIKETCRRWEQFTSEDVADILDELDVHTHEPRAMGGMMRKAQAAGYCEPTDEHIPSHRTTSNSYNKRVWRRKFIPNGKWAA